MKNLRFAYIATRFNTPLALGSSTYVKTILGITILTLAVSCSPEPGKSKKERIEEQIVEKLQRWQSRRVATCRNTAMEIAFANADSMILEYAREQKLQLERPSRPIRPEEPELRRPNDTLKLAPFLEDSM